MNCDLKELSVDLLNKDLYDMYQDIPNDYNGQTNDAFGLDEYMGHIKNR